MHVAKPFGSSRNCPLQLATSKTGAPDILPLVLSFLAHGPVVKKLATDEHELEIFVWGRIRESNGTPEHQPKHSACGQAQVQPAASAVEAQLDGGWRCGKQSWKTQVVLVRLMV